jgi:hypothetical protein
MNHLEYRYLLELENSMKDNLYLLQTIRRLQFEIDLLKQNMQKSQRREKIQAHKETPKEIQKFLLNQKNVPIFPKKNTKSQEAPFSNEIKFFDSSPKQKF